MNKKLAMLFGAGIMALTACSLPFGNKAKKAIKDLEDQGAILSEFQGHKVATKVKDGDEFYMGIYRRNEDLIRFCNGKYHEDSAGFYPFYMSTTSATVEGACTVKVEMINSKEKTFGLLVSAPGEVWDGKYLGVYGSLSSVGKNNPVTSLALLDDPTQTEYDTITNHQVKNSETVSCSGVFKFFDYYEDEPVCAPGCIYKNTYFDEEEATPKFFGTGHNSKVDEGEEDYFSMDAKMWAEAVSPEAYDLMHLYTL